MENETFTRKEQMRHFGLLFSKQTFPKCVKMSFLSRVMD